MNQFYDNDTTVSISDVRRELLKTAKDQQDQIDRLTQRLADTKNTLSSVADARNFAGIVNVLDNALPEWSKDAYDTTTVLPNSAGDGNMEAKNWYRQLASDLALAPATGTACKTAKTVEPADHSLWAANEFVNLDIPRWSKKDAWFEMGGVTQKWDMYYPIPNDVIFPGHRFTLQFEAMMAGNNPAPFGMQFYGGLYDSTPGQQKYIEGGAFTITDTNGHDPGVPFGIAGSTSVDYQVLARTDSGEEAISNILNFPNANYPFDQNNHPRIRFSGVPGFIEFEIYRKIGTEYVLQFTVRNTIDGTYFDVGNPPEAHVAGFPTVTITAPRAFALTTNFQAGTIFGLGFIRNALTILVPTTYNRSLTTPGMQYLRMGFTLNTATAADRVLIRKLGLSMGDGNWARSAHDTQAGAHSTPSGSAAVGSPPSGGGGGGGGVDPPPPTGGGGGGACVLVETPIRTAKGDVPLKELEKGRRNGTMLDGGGPIFRRIKRIRFGHASYVLRFKFKNGCEVACTPDHPFITSENDQSGTAAAELKRKFDDGEMVTSLTKPKNKIVRSVLVSVTEEIGDFTVGIPTVDGEILIAGGCLMHNRKADIDLAFP